MNEATKAPTYPAESVEKWAKVKEAAAAADTSAVQAALEAMNLSRRLAPLMIAAVAEETELAAIEKAGEGMADKLRGIEEQWGFIHASPPPTKIEKMRELAAERKQLADERLQAQRAIAAAKTASRQRAWLQFWLAEVFGEDPLDHAGCLSSLMPSPKVFDAMVNLRIAGTVYAIGPDGWRKVNESNEQDRPRRRYASFSPTAPRR
jgi:hypothetical protein